MADTKSNFHCGSDQMNQTDRVSVGYATASTVFIRLNDNVLKLSSAEDGNYMSCESSCPGNSWCEITMEIWLLQQRSRFPPVNTAVRFLC